MKKAHAITMLRAVSKAAQGQPKEGYNRKAVFLEAADVCDAGSTTICGYELSYRDIDSIIKMLEDEK